MFQLNPGFSTLAPVPSVSWYRFWYHGSGSYCWIPEFWYRVFLWIIWINLISVLVRFHFGTISIPRALVLLPKLTGIYPTGQSYSLELMFAKFATVKIAKDLNPLKITYNRLWMSENPNCVHWNDVTWLPRLGLDPRTIRLQIQGSTNWATQTLEHSAKIS